jgi:flavin-dependent dehydrogenase
MLLGDAASLIDPFTGEGIANGMICGMHAAAVAADAIKLGRTDADFLNEYDFRVYRRLWKELNISRRLQQLLKYPWLFDAVVKKANKNTALKDAMSSMFSDLDMRSRLKKLSFYFGLFFR